MDEELDKLKMTFNSVETMLANFATVYSKTHEGLRNMKKLKEKYCNSVGSGEYCGAAGRVRVRSATGCLK